MPPRRRFCLLTTGRTGSTSLMSALAAREDVLVPGKLFECPDNELVHPSFVRGYMEWFGARDAGELIERFFEWGTERYAGFKSMPNRHRDYREFIRRTDIQFITLVRDDIASTVASFILAMRTNSWRRSGGEQVHTWTFTEADERLVAGNLKYVYTSRLRLQAIPNAIPLVYEELCDPRFRCDALDEFFERPVRIHDPRPPLHASRYVTNWTELEQFIERTLARYSLDSSSSSSP
ncbi:MAG TPA: hypothetical protein VKB93_10290 [Thermoanaerobaculia bacterium]|nr:hypothetical protein [Thermoanaerobaculia bacterium]